MWQLSSDLNWVAVSCIELPWVALSCIKLHWVALSCPEQLRLSCIELPWVVVSCIELNWRYWSNHYWLTVTDCCAEWKVTCPSLLGFSLVLTSSPDGNIIYGGCSNEILFCFLFAFGSDFVWKMDKGVTEKWQPLWKKSPKCSHKVVGIFPFKELRTFTHIFSWKRRELLFFYIFQYWDFLFLIFI